MHRDTGFLGFLTVVGLVLSACAPAAPPAAAPTSAAVSPATVAPQAVASSAAAPAASQGAPSPSPVASPSQAAMAYPTALPVTAVAGASPTQVSICIPAQSDTILPAFAARDGGYLSKLNISAELPYFAGGKVDTALAAGQCDFLFGAGGIGPLLQGQDIVAIAATTPVPTSEIWGDPDINGIAGLKGKAIATSGAGSLSWRLARYYLQLNNLVPDTDVGVVATGSDAANLGAVTSHSGVVVAAVLSPPATFIAQKQGLKLIYRPPASVHTLNTGLITTRAYLDAHRPVALALLHGISDAINRLETDQGFYKQELEKFTQQQLSESDAAQDWDAARHEWVLPPRIDHDGAIATLNLYSDEAKNMNLDDIATRWLDMSLVNQLFPSL